MRRNQSGVALLEALVGILIFSIGILAMMGLQAQAIRNTVDAKYRNEAAYLANQIIGQMWVDRTNLADFDTTSGAAAAMDTWRKKVASTLPRVTVGGTNSPVIAIAGNQATVTVFWQMPGADSVQHQFTIVAQINGTGP
ncbi:MAG TPA: type IV pilus modification protein PilV [Steroidobacteraceae bacterium]|nr:type IV pilus modification protein PilV [Steroidobacteraceae bacterium]